MAIGCTVLRKGAKLGVINAMVTHTLTYSMGSLGYTDNAYRGRIATGYMHRRGCCVLRWIEGVSKLNRIGNMVL